MKKILLFGLVLFLGGCHVHTYSEVSVNIKELVKGELVETHEEYEELKIVETNDTVTINDVSYDRRFTAIEVLHNGRSIMYHPNVDDDKNYELLKELDYEGENYKLYRITDKKPSGLEIGFGHVEKEVSENGAIKFYVSPLNHTIEYKGLRMSGVSWIDNGMSDEVFKMLDQGIVVISYFETISELTFEDKHYELKRLNYNFIERRIPSDDDFYLNGLHYDISDSDLYRIFVNDYAYDAREFFMFNDFPDYVVDKIMIELFDEGVMKEASN